MTKTNRIAPGIYSLSAKGIDYCEQKELLSRQGKWPAGLKFEDCVPSKSDGHGKVPVPTYAGSLMGCSAAACAGR